VNATILKKLFEDPVAIQQVTNDAIVFCHKHNLFGINFYLEPTRDNPTDWASDGNLQAFLQSFVKGMNSAEPPLQVTYDLRYHVDQPNGLPDGGDLTPEEVVEGMQRWISMETYCLDNDQYKENFAHQKNGSPEGAFGAGLCPSCQELTEDDVEMRFAYLEENPDVTEIAMWAVWASEGNSGQNEIGWEFYWDRMEKWLVGGKRTLNNDILKVDETQRLTINGN